VLSLAEPIKALGTHSVQVKLHTDVEFPVTVEVVSA
jgi:ribosomal protein L9